MTNRFKNNIVDTPAKLAIIQKGRRKIETVKNFLVGFFIVVLAFIAVVLGLFLWPLMIGIGSFILFIAVITLSIIIAFYIIVLIGYMVRKAFGPKS